MTSITPSPLASYARMVLGELPEDWRYAQIRDLLDDGTLAEVQDGNHGEIHPKSTDYVASGVPFVMARDIINNRLNLGDCNFISRQQAGSLRIGFARPGDVLLTHKATMGRVAMVPMGHEYIMLTPQVTYYRIGNAAALTAPYLKYAFLSPRFQTQLHSSSDQSTRKYIGITAQRDLWIPIAPPHKQERIAAILGSLDDKIELNRRMNETLEAIVRRLFRSWFVDFDPVNAKAAVRREHPKWDNARVSREALPNLDPAIAEAFPDDFEESELGSIPKGWRVDEIGNVVKVLGGGTPSTKNPAFWQGGTHPFCTPRDMAGLNFPVLLETERELTDDGVAKVSSGQLDVGTVILSSRAPIGYLAITAIPVSVNQGIIAMVCDGEISNYYALQWAHANMDAIEANANGSTFQEISKKNFRPIPIVIPDAQILSQFNERASDLHGLILENARESLALQSTRDKLLPRLLSGELEVENAN